MKIEVKKSPYTSKLGGDIDITFSTDDGWLFNTVANISVKDLRQLKRKIRRYLSEVREKDKPYFGVKIFKGKYPDRNGRDIELSVCTNANYWVGLPNMNI